MASIFGPGPVKVATVAAAAAAMAAASAAAAMAAPPAGPAYEPVDLGAVHQIKAEGLRRSRVMDYASQLTDVYGARLTGSPELRAAADYTVKTLKEMGLTNARLESWGPFGRGWSQEHFDAHVTKPFRYSLFGYPKAWTPSTNGRVSGEAVIVNLGRDEDLQAAQGKLRGRFVLLAAPREATAPFTPPARRLTDGDLADLTREADPARIGPRLPGLPANVGTGSGFGAAPAGGGGGPSPPAGPGAAAAAQQPAPLYMSPPDPSAPAASPTAAAQRAFVAKRMKFLIDEGALAVLEPGRGDAGIFVVGSGGPRDAKAAPVIPQIILTAEHYGRVARTLGRKMPVTIEMDVRNKFHDGDPSSFNVVADLPGTDKRDEVVMLGAHIDSWHAGTGATDNAAGVAIMMEALRILKESGVKLRRTVRIGLWSGEEQGLYGSRGYVKAHFADRATMKTRPEHAKLSAYFNLDNGTGAVRGIFAQNNDAIVPIFEAWVAPLKSLGVSTVSPRNTGSTDHIAFDEVGLPGFQFIQDPVDYDSRTHHTNVDTFERLQANDMMKSATAIAVFAYHAATRADRLPRKPMPKASDRRTPNAIPPSARPRSTAPGTPQSSRPADDPTPPS